MNGRQGRDFASDNTAGVAPEIMAAIQAANHGPASSYGADALTARLTALARELFETELEIFPVATGTAANGLSLAAVSPPYGAIYCHETAHVLIEECGAPEFYSGGAKLIGLPGPAGRLTSAGLETALAQAAESGVHHATPAAISITQATEWGTVYQPAAVAELGQLARARGLRLHMDGARLANAIARLGCSPAAATWRAGVDVLSLGATKNGALAAEAVLVFDPALAKGMAERRKRAGHLFSKQRFLSAQLLAYLEDGLWLANAGHANRLAGRLGAGLARLPGCRLAHPVEANEVFAVLPDLAIDALLAEGFRFYRWPGEGGGSSIRLVTAFNSDDADIDAFLAAAARHVAAAAGRAA